MPSFFRKGREPETKFNRGLSTAAPCCPPLPYLIETWQPRYRQPQSRGLCLIPKGCTVAVWGLEHDGDCDCICDLRARCAAAVQSHNTTPPWDLEEVSLVWLVVTLSDPERQAQKKNFGSQHVLATEA